MLCIILHLPCFKYKISPCLTFSYLPDFYDRCNHMRINWRSYCNSDVIIRQTSRLYVAPVLQPGAVLTRNPVLVSTPIWLKERVICIRLLYYPLVHRLFNVLYENNKDLSIRWLFCMNIKTLGIISSWMCQYYPAMLINSFF